MELAREGDGGEREGGDDVPPPLQREQERREQEGDQADQVPGRLAHPVRHQAEDHAAGERGGTGRVERPEPPARERAGEHEREQHNHVVGPHVAEGSRQRPVRQSEQPALEARRRLRLRPERVRVRERRRASLELVPDEPEAPAELEVVSCRRLAVSCRRPREVVTFDVPDRRPRRPERADGIQRARDDDKTATVWHEATTVSLTVPGACNGLLPSCGGSTSLRRPPCGGTAAARSVYHRRRESGGLP